MMRNVTLRADGNYDVDAASLEAGLDCSVDGKGKAIQSQRDEVDINTIVKRFGLTGQLPVSERTPLDVDFSGGDIDYRECLDIIRKAEASYNSMPAEVRALWQNDPALMVDWLADEKNVARARELGLRRPAETVAAPPAAPGTPTPAPAPGSP